MRSPRPAHDRHRGASSGTLRPPQSRPGALRLCLRRAGGCSSRIRSRSAARAAVSASARVDFTASTAPSSARACRPRSSRRGVDGRISVGAGAFAPTPSPRRPTTRLSRLAPLVGLDAERARTASADLTWQSGPFEITATGRLDRRRPRAARDAWPRSRSWPDHLPVGLFNAPEPTRTYGTECLVRYRRGPSGHGDARLHPGHRARSRTGQRREVPLSAA